MWTDLAADIQQGERLLQLRQTTQSVAGRDLE